MKNTFAIAAIAVVVAFLLGFIPEYVKAERLGSELAAEKQANSGAGLRDLAALAYIQANQKNYGLAAESSSRFFDRARAFVNQSSDANAKTTLESVLALRDKVTAELAKGDAAAIGDLQDIFAKTRQATLPAAER
jgi:hypothetical protein